MHDASDEGVARACPEIPRTDPHIIDRDHRLWGPDVAFLGRISLEKGPDRAIWIARTLGIPLKIAAKVDKADEAYFHEKIVPLLSDPGVEFIGEINERSKMDMGLMAIEVATLPKRVDLV